jgi:hypothetical protein
LAWLFFAINGNAAFRINARSAPFSRSRVEICFPAAQKVSGAGDASGPVNDEGASFAGETSAHGALGLAAERESKFGCVSG